MDRAQLLALLTPEALRMLDEAGAMLDTQDPVRLVAALRARGLSSETVSAVLTQARLRRRGREKFGPFADRMLFTEAGLQQATRLAVAAHHAGRFRDAGATRVADLGCGIGGDAMALASLGFEVTAVDADEVTAAIATHNLAMFEGARVRHARVEELALDEFDALWFDPARRRTDGGRTRRLPDPADWSPSLDVAFGAAASHVIGVKLGPGIDHDLLPVDAETQWVSVDGSLVEATVWDGGAAREGIRRSALVMGRGGTHEWSAPGPADDEPVGELGAYLMEPDAAIIRARLIGDVARSIGARMLAPDIAWMTADTPAESPFAATFRVRDVLPLQAAKLGRELRTRGIGSLEIKKRGVDLDPATFRTKLALRGEAHATLICTRVGGQRRAILADRVVTAPSA